MDAPPLGRTTTSYTFSISIGMHGDVVVLLCMLSLHLAGYDLEVFNDGRYAGWLDIRILRIWI